VLQKKPLQAHLVAVVLDDEEEPKEATEEVIEIQELS
jgi:hypothetical protein